MILTERDKRFLLRGMSLARGVLKNTPCTHHEVVRDYQDMIAESWAEARSRSSLIITY